MPFMPRTTETVYTRQVTARIAMVMRRVSPNPKSSETIWLIRGVASVKVVVVPASSAKTAIRSIRVPASPSVCFPRIGRQASEYFCLWQPRT